jgi:hypothetical protein
MNQKKAVAWMAGAGLALVLAGCGGGGSGSATIGGSVSGLAANESLVLTNNGGDSITVSSNTSFKFAHSIGSQGAYNVQVATQPANQTCSVSQGSGVVNYSGDNISDVAVVCTNNAPISATISGLAANDSVTVSVTLANSPSTSNFYTTTTTTNGKIASFTNQLGTTITALPLGTLYTVAISQRPVNPLQTCTVDPSTPPSGGVVSSNAINVNFTCQ